MSNRPAGRLIYSVGLAIAALGLVTVAPVAAQVGHPPGSSPYRHIRARQILSLTGGYFSGGAGKAGVGPTSGALGGAHLDFRLGGLAMFDLGFQLGTFDRLVLDPTRLPDARVKSTETQRVAVADVGMALVLTGAKTWNGLAPYFGATFGMAFGGGVPADSSGFQFRSHFHAGPKIGFRFFVTDRVVFRAEGRDIIWRLSYPTLFFTAPPEDPDAPPVLDPLSTKRTEWVHHPTLSFSLGYAIRM